ncbi:MAG: type ISP restriction/modification enzyme [Pseudomonadota bacterium]
MEAVPPYHFFVPKDFTSQDEYSKYWKLKEIFKDWSSGIKTHRDHFVVGFSKEAIIQKLRVFTGKLPDEIVAQSLNLKDTEDWKLTEARQKIIDKKPEDKIYPYAYRPFEIIWICYESSLVDRDRQPFMGHLLKENMCLVTTRILSSAPFFHAFISNVLSDICLISAKTKETAYFFPLYLYPNEPETQLFGKEAPDKKCTQNLTSEFLQAIKASLGVEPDPKEIFCYIYAVLYSSTYRKRYEEFLKIDFPHLPLPTSLMLFRDLARLGNKLVALHLMESSTLGKHITKFIGKGDNEVVKVRYDNETVWINNEQGFMGVREDVWNFHIGGYQVCEKWLKDRKGRVLSNEDITHYHKIVVSINETIRLMAEIDKVIETHGGWPDAFTTPMT